MELFSYQPTLVTTERSKASIFNDLGGYDCDFLECPPDSLLCLICTFVATEPMQMDCCGRVYCKHCLNEHKKHSTACPNCRKQGKGFFDRKSEREVNALKVKCANFKNGCEWRGELAALNKHLTTCDHALLPCPNECKESADITQLLRKDLKAHLKDNCPNRSYECPHCKKKGKHYYVTSTHLERCPKVAVACPNVDCGEEINRCDIAKHLTECPFEIVPCKFTKLGCGEKRTRKEVEGHEKNYKSHFQLAMETVVKLKEELRQNKKKRFMMPQFSKYKSSGKSFTSPAFYTHQGGYKMCIYAHVCYGNLTATYISVYASFMKGEYDDSLTWPFTGSVTVTLLNQLEDKNHHHYTIEYQEGMDNGSSRVTTGLRSRGYGTSRFLPHEALAHNPVTNCQYLKDDCLCFEISVRADSIKPWLAPTL